MFKKTDLIRKVSLLAVSTVVFAAPALASHRDGFDLRALRGTFVLSLDGAFVSAPPPFTGDVLQFKASQIGRLVLDGTGQAWGEATLTFHHPDIPFNVISRLAFRGTYDVAPDGRAILNLDEFPLAPNGEPAATRSNSIVLECYVVRRRLNSRCVLHTLISYQQGPEPRSLPVTMSGSLRRQR